MDTDTKVFRLSLAECKIIRDCLINAEPMNWDPIEKKVEQQEALMALAEFSSICLNWEQIPEE